MFQPPPNPGTPVQCQKTPAVPKVFSPTAHTSVGLTINASQSGPALVPVSPAVCSRHPTPSQWIASAVHPRFGIPTPPTKAHWLIAVGGGGVGLGPLKVKFVNPTAQPSFGLIGLFGGPNVTAVKLYAIGTVGKPMNCGAGTKFHV